MKQRDNIIMYSVVATLALTVLIIINYICGNSTHEHTFLHVVTNVLFSGVLLVQAINIVNEVTRRV